MASEPTAEGQGDEKPEIKPTLGELYKELKQLQIDGADEENMYEKAFALNKAAMDSLTNDSATEDVVTRCKGILIDINPILARAAVDGSVKGNSAIMSRFSKAYADARMLPQMEGAQFRTDDILHPALLYCAAQGTYNSGDYEGAITYFEEYLKTGDTKNREQVILYYGHSILASERQQQGLMTLFRGANEYPSNTQILKVAMQLCIDTRRNDLLEPLLDRALAISPNDEKLLNLQAQIFEEKRDFLAALNNYMRLLEMRPNSLGVNEAVGRSYYNLATLNYNDALTATNEKDAARSRRKSNSYFSSAADRFEELASNDPDNVKYLRALGTCYACLGNTSKVDAVNIQLSALGQQPMAMNTMPAIIGDSKTPEGKGREIPSFQEFGQEFVTSEMKKWAQRGEFEKIEDFRARVNSSKAAEKQMQLSKISEDEYLKKYASHLMLSELSLQPYDVENETYAVTSSFGEVYVKVPLKNKEAELFKSNWERMRISNVKYQIKNDGIAFSTISFQTPAGKTYTYNSDNLLSYKPTIVEVDMESLLASGNTQNKERPGAQRATRPNKLRITLESDVDKDIPQYKGNNKNTVALVIANEDYANVSNVTSAEHDGAIIAKYMRETLGIPENQVLVYENATYGNMFSALRQLKSTVEALGPGTDVIFYYAGHGVPDEHTSDAYVLPVDADPLVVSTAVSLKELYNQLQNMNASNVMAFIDACFSGSNRGDGMLADARAVVINPKSVPLRGSNMFVLSAASGKETALPWKKKNHGLFTYYLLKKLQESKGKASLQEISDYVTEQVQKTASLEFKKEQHPTMNASGELARKLSDKSLR